MKDHNVLECQSIKKAYGGVTALAGVDFVGRSGEVHALLGENGAGKSTLVKIISGSVAPDDGQVLLDGNAIRVHGPRHADRLGIAVAFQDLSLLPHLSVAENIFLRERGQGTLLRKKRLREQARRLFDQLAVPIDLPTEAIVGDLPIALRQVLEIASAVAHSHRVLILDEPTSSLGNEETTWLLRLARQEAATGKAVVFISHRLHEIREVADTVTILRGGRAVLSGAVNLLNDDAIVEAMLGRKPERLYPGPIAAPRSRTLLQVETFSVGRRVRGVSFELDEGEIVGLGGLEGHGQSELLLGLFGIEAGRGNVRLGGRTVRIRSPLHAMRAGIGLVLIPEDRGREGLLLPKSVRENIALPVLRDLTRLGLLSLAREESLTAQAIKRFSIRTAGGHQIVASLSGGNQQKVLIAKMLNVGARVLLLHDITRGVDVGTKAEIFQFARELTADGFAILMYSSDNDELVNICDRVLVFREGGIVAELKADHLTEDGILRAALGIRSDDRKLAV